MHMSVFAAVCLTCFSFELLLPRVACRFALISMNWCEFSFSVFESSFPKPCWLTFDFCDSNTCIAEHVPSMLQCIAYGWRSSILVLCPAGCTESFWNQLGVISFQHLFGNGEPAFSDFQWLTLSCGQFLFACKQTEMLYSRLPGARSPYNVMRCPNGRPSAWARPPSADLRIIAGRLMRQAMTRNLYPRRPWSLHRITSCHSQCLLWTDKLTNKQSRYWVN